jgi:hypothetical protein
MLLLQHNNSNRKNFYLLEGAFGDCVEKVSQGHKEKNLEELCCAVLSVFFLF